MSFVSPFTTLQMMLLNDRHRLPWILTEKLVYESPLTGEEYTIPRNFRTNLVSMPKMLAALPGIGGFVVLKFFGQGVWLGAKEAVLHDWLRTPDRTSGELPVSPIVAHRIFRESLYDAGYDSEMIELYYSAVVTFNS